MNFRKTYIKSGLFLIQMLLAFNFVYSQQYILEFKNTTDSEKKTKKYNSYKDLILGVEDSILSIKKQGFIQAKVNRFIKKDSFNYEISIDKNLRVKYIQISNKDKLGKNIVKILNNYYVDDDLVEYKNLTPITKNISEFLSKNGYPFASISYTDLKITDSLTIKLKLKIDYGSKRFLNEIIVKGYYNFPKKFLKNIFKLDKNRSFDLERIIINHRKIDNTKFARNIRDPEILFTNDSTSVYLYIEKLKRNSFDGLINFNSNENSGKINFNGYANISLVNNFNGGEEINFNYKSQTNDDKSLISNFYIPHIFGTSLNLRFYLDLVKRDSTFTSNTIKYDLDLNLGGIKTGLGFQKIKSNSENEFENIQSFESNIFNFFTEYLSFNNNDIFFSEKFGVNVSYGLGKKIQLSEKSNLSQYYIQLRRLFNLSNRFKLKSKITLHQIKSKNLVINELLRFGGANTIRGFEENSIFADNLRLLNTSLNYYLNDTIYIYTIFDMANYSNKVSNFKENIYSGGMGFSYVTENGFISINYSKGNRWGRKFSLKDAKIGINFVSFF